MAFSLSFAIWARSFLLSLTIKSDSDFIVVAMLLVENVLKIAAVSLEPSVCKCDTLMFFVTMILMSIHKRKKGNRHSRLKYSDVLNGQNICET